MDYDEADRQRIREEIRLSRRMTDLERLQWLEEICVFTNMFWQAPAVERPGPTVYTDASGRGDKA